MQATRRRCLSAARCGYALLSLQLALSEVMEGEASLSGSEDGLDERGQISGHTTLPGLSSSLHRGAGLPRGGAASPCACESVAVNLWTACGQVYVHLFAELRKGLEPLRAARPATQVTRPPLLIALSLL